MFGLIFDFLCFFLTETNLQLGMIPTLRPKFFYPLDLGRPVSNEPPPPNDSQSIKRKRNPRMTTIMLPGLSFRSAFVFSINSCCVVYFDLFSFH